MDDFFLYKQDLSKHTLSNHRVCLKTFAKYQIFGNEVPQNISVSDKVKLYNLTKHLFSCFSVWSDISTKTISEFGEWLITQGFAQSTVKMYLETVERYFKLVQQS